MNRQEAEKLLGGYAAGNLTDQERSALFTAALGNQELFNALVDEEALREVLADPEARRRLLRALPPPQSEGFWAWLRRPSAVGLAASIAAVSIVGIAIWEYTKPAAPAIVRSRRVTAEDLGKPEAPALIKKPSPRPEPAGQAPPARQLSGGSGGGSRPPQIVEKKAQPAAIGAVAPPVRAEKEASTPEAAENRSADAATAADSNAIQAPASPTRAKAELLRHFSAQAVADRASAEAPAGQITAQFRRLDADRATVHVHSSSGGYVYLLKRANGGVDVLMASRSVVGPSGTTEAEYDVTLGSLDALDLYVLSEAAGIPASLPPASTTTGYYRRLYPTTQTIPLQIR